VSYVPLVDLAAAYAEQQDELERAILRVCRSQRFVGGEEVSAFEQEFASYLGARHAIGVASGTGALEVVIRALGIGPGDDVLVPANTFIATAEAVTSPGGTPRFADVDALSGLIDLDSAADLVGSRTRAIIPVHLYGRMADMEKVNRFAAQHGLVVIEDAAQAHGGSSSVGRAGTLGIAGCFSFYPGKNLGAFGDGGAVVTNDDTLAERVRLLRDHGRRERDRHELLGLNCRLDAVQAAALRVKLPRLDAWNRERRRVADHYRELLPPSVLDWRASTPEGEVHHLFPILTPRRDALARYLRSLGVHTGVHYPQALPRTPPFAHSRDACPAAERRASWQLSLPIHPHLLANDIETIAEAVATFCGRDGD
jgi:dTDP-4-amino-4,6-dideoxygalactose transaminase